MNASKMGFFNIALYSIVFLYPFRNFFDKEDFIWIKFNIREIASAYFGFTEFTTINSYESVLKTSFEYTCPQSTKLEPLLALASVIVFLSVFCESKYLRYNLIFGSH
jgi:hypothetical protein